MRGRVLGLMLGFAAIAALSGPAFADDDDDGRPPKIEAVTFTRFEQAGRVRPRLDTFTRRADSVELYLRDGVEDAEAKPDRRENIDGKPWRIDDGRLLRLFDKAIEERGGFLFQVTAEGEGGRTRKDVVFRPVKCDRQPPPPAWLVCEGRVPP